MNSATYDKSGAAAIHTAIALLADTVRSIPPTRIIASDPIIELAP